MVKFGKSIIIKMTKKLKYKVCNKLFYYKIIRK